MALVQLFWAGSLVGTLVMTWHVVPLTHHLYMRFALNARQSSVAAELFRYLYAVTAMTYSVLAVWVVSDTVCVRLLYARSLAASLNGWALLCFLADKVAVAQRLRGLLGHRPTSRLRRALLTSHVLSLTLTVSYMVSLWTGSVANGEHTGCVTRASGLTGLCQALMLALQLLCSHMFVDSMRIVYHSQRAHFTDENNELPVYGSERQILAELETVVNRNARWCVWSGVSIAAVYAVRYGLVLAGSHTGLSAHALVALRVWTLALNCFIMVRLMSWNDIYGRPLAVLYYRNYRVRWCVDAWWQGQQWLVACCHREAENDRLTMVSTARGLTVPVELRTMVSDTVVAQDGSASEDGSALRSATHIGR